ncbi:ead/Ea22-like family protein [Enterobacter asburiae]|uniref:ead/Ea22-like family protein n=1 Tax=Enterobacter asburiae TaxID=61645 RepID=UPI00402AA23F
MSNIDKRALREAAEKAISEEGETWWNEDQLASDYGLALHRTDAKFIAAANPASVLALLDELEAKDKRIAELEATQGKPVMFIDGDISPADAEKLAAVIREFNEETKTPAARMARIIRENPHPTNMCDMPAAAAGKGEAS